MELLSGLLLTLVVLAILAFVARELVTDYAGGSTGTDLGDTPPTDAPMLGKLGTVLENSGARLRVRIEGERWSATPAAGAELPPGASVRVTAVSGLVLEVEPTSAENALPLVEADGDERQQHAQ